METRMNINKVFGAIKALRAISDHQTSSPLEQSLIDLILIRASQINHCAFCLDMHTKDARVSGETEQRIYALSAWRETPFFTERERAALTWTEAVTVPTQNGVPDELYAQVREQFTEEEVVSLTMAVITINSWNRLNVSLQFNIPGSYKSQRHPDAVHAAVAG